MSKPGSPAWAAEFGRKLQGRPVAALLVAAAIAATGLVLLSGIVRFAAWTLGVESKAIVVALVGFVVWLIQQAIQRNHELERRLAEQKRAQYLEFLDFLNGLLPIAGQAAQQQPNPEQARLLRRWSLYLTMTGSDAVCQEWIRMQGLATGADDATLLNERVRAWARLVHEMRRDSGHPKTTLRPSDMLAPILTDIDQYRATIDAPGPSRR